MRSPKHTVELRQQNKLAVLRLLFLTGPMSRLEIGQRANFSPGTATNVTSDLLQEGILHETGSVESENGRPRVILAVNPGYGYLVGVDVGETHIQMELFDLSWKNLGVSWRNIAEAENSPERYVALIKDSLDELIATTSIDPNLILGVGLGVPGVVEHSRGVRIASPMWAWRSVDLRSLLEASLNIPVYIDNGAKGMSLAEAWFGAGRGMQDMAVILIGTGVGAGMITKGALYRGATNSAGEWGHTKIVLEGRPCRCGSQGCLEAYTGAPGIIASLHELGFDDPALNESQESAIKAFVEAYQAGDPIATKVMYDTAHYLGAGLANLVNLFNPELIVIGGWVGLMIGEYILDYLNMFVQKYALPPSVAHLKIDTCQLAHDAICTGAACLILEEFLSGNPKFARRSSLPAA